MSKANVRKYFVAHLAILCGIACISVVSCISLPSGQTADAAAQDSKNKNEKPVVAPSQAAGGKPSSQAPVDQVEAAAKAGDIIQLQRLLDEKRLDPTKTNRAKAVIASYVNKDASTAPYRKGRMEQKIRTVPAALRDRIFTEPAETLDTVVDFLMQRESDPFLKAKIIHDWITDVVAYDTEAYFSRNIPAQDPEAVLKRKKAVCSGYANLFARMAVRAGLEAKVLSGFSKGFGYRGRIGNDTDHAWNSVFIKGKWYLLDPTWNAGFVDGRSFIKKYSTEYLFIDSRAMLYSHLPERVENQYFSPPLSREQFVAEPYVAGRFFQYGLDFKSAAPTASSGGEGLLRFSLTQAFQGLGVSCSVSDAEGGRQREHAFFNRQGGTLNFFFSGPPGSESTANIYAAICIKANFRER